MIRGDTIWTFRREFEIFNESNLFCIICVYGRASFGQILSFQVSTTKMFGYSYATTKLLFSVKCFVFDNTEDSLAKGVSNDARRCGLKSDIKELKVFCLMSRMKSVISKTNLPTKRNTLKEENVTCKLRKKIKGSILRRPGKKWSQKYTFPVITIP